MLVAAPLALAAAFKTPAGRLRIPRSGSGFEPLPSLQLLSFRHNQQQGQRHVIEIGRCARGTSEMSRQRSARDGVQI